jgi:hypothetical protein
MSVSRSEPTPPGSDPAAANRSPVWRRTALTLVLATVGAVLFIPLMQAGEPPSPGPPGGIWLIFPAATAGVCAVLGWLGFRWSDCLDLPMPLLRPWELGAPVRLGEATRALLIAVSAGILLGLAGLAAVKALGVPHNPGALTVRAASTLFAAVVTEAVVHLFMLSGLLRLFGPRRLTFLVLTSIVFVAIFHGGGVQGNWILSGAVMGMNFLMAMAMGAIFLGLGFEAAVIAHATAHLILLSFS